MNVVRLLIEDLKDYQFEIAGPESAERLKTFWRKSFQEAYHEVHAATDMQAYCTRNFTEEAALQVLSDQSSVCSFALKSGEIVGLSVTIQNSFPVEPETPAIELKQLYVLASEYGTGLGKIMMKEAIEYAKASESKHMWLCVSNLNFRAFRFYQKFGFRKACNGPLLEVGLDRLLSSIMVREV